MAKKERASKGVFSEARLPSAGKYLVPGRRRAQLLAGAAIVAVCAIALAVGWLVRGRAVLASGPLSSHHANFESSCSSCHAEGRAQFSETCLVCHGRFGREPGPYTWAAHYVYRSGDPGRGGREASKRRETECNGCHVEHRGRQADLVADSDRSCRGCHSIDTFDRDHPEFQFVREERPDDPHLRFPHRRHVKEVLAKLALADPQRACLECHRPLASGVGFEPIRFDQACDGCHLTEQVGTSLLPVGDPADPLTAGVETLAMIQAQGGLGARWAYWSDPGEFREVGSRVSKRPLYHQDPWVLHNLKRIERLLYPEGGLASLLRGRVDAGSDRSPRELYTEAIDVLDGQILELRARPEAAVQEELRYLEGLVATARRRLEETGGVVSAEAFMDLGPLNRTATEQQVADLRALAMDLSEACRHCHVVSDAGIQAVERDQRVLRRAEFDHHAHLLQRPLCLDCHDVIAGLDDPDAWEEADDLEDVAEIENVPGIARCRECHRSGEASTACTTCHRFHPERNPFADFLLYETAGVDGP